MSFNNFVHRYIIKNKATSNIKSYRVLSFVGLDIVDLYARDEPFSSVVGNVYLHPKKNSLGFIRKRNLF